MKETPDQEPSPEADAAKLRGILESALTAIITINDRGLIEAVNPAAERLFGYSAAELISKNVKTLMPEPYQSEHDRYISNYLASGTKKIIGIGREVRGRRSNGTTFPLHLSVSEFMANGHRYFTGMIQDLSDRTHVEEALRESERRLAQAQKMEAVGQLTGGIAHDFNNLLLVITGNLELLEPYLSGDLPKDLLKEAQDAALLGSKLTDQLLSFARQRHMNIETVRLNEQVVGIVDLLRRSLGEQVNLSTVLSPDAGSIRADPGQFQSALVNMAVNARDAMPSGGRLVIETRKITFDPDHSDFHSELKPGDYIQLSISDTGVGMSPEIRDRVFEPFFTTKEKGRGTGLGLAMVYGSVRQCGGHVTIHGEVGHGTTFNLYFPQADEAISSVSPGTVDKDQPSRRATILVVEDDERVRQLTLKRLKIIGYQVIEAENGPRAVEILKNEPSVDLVLTDLIMPGGMSGRDVASRAQELKPGIKILLTSGYAEELVHGTDLEAERYRVLRKPYHLTDLEAALREVFGASGGNA